MAIKAKAEITLSHMIDVTGTYRYYLLQSSTASAPAKPTTYPPSSAWDDTEPSYTSGSTNSLYFVDCSVYSNGTFYYSPVSLSTSYEAAKEAYTTALAAKELGIEYIVGTQTAATNAWKGNTTDASLKTGKTIAYKLPYAGNSSAATLNLTLSGGGTTGAKGIRRLDSTVTTNYVAGSIVHMTYDGTYWRITDYNSDTYDRVRYNKAIKCGTTAIVAANIIVGTGGLYKHLKAGTAFDVSYPILYAASAIAASATGTNNYLCYSFTVTTTQSITLTAYKPVYIKGTLSGTTFTPVSTAPLTQTVPTSNDGYYYILLGHAITSTTMYLTLEHPIYTYFNGSFKAVSQIAVEAAKTATNYMEFAGDYGDGLVIGDLTKSVLGKNAYIDSEGFYVRNGTDVLASFGANAIKLGIASENAKVYLCGEAGSISGYSSGGTDSFDSLSMYADEFLSFRSNMVSLNASEAVSLYSNESTETSRMWVAPSFINMRSSDSSTGAETSVYVSPDGLQINGEQLADYVVEQGSIGIWTYEKWASGKVVCYGLNSYNNQAITTAYSSKYYYKLFTEALPFTLKTGKSINVSVTGQGIDWAGRSYFNNNTNATTISFFWCNGSSYTTATSGSYASFYVVGTWK